MSTQKRSAHKKRRRAVVAVFTAISLIPIFAFCMLAIDVGHMYAVRAELQNAADAAALAAAGHVLSPDAADLSSDAYMFASEYAGKNKVLLAEPKITEADVEVGRGRAAGERFEFVPGATNADAVRVTVRRTDGSPNGAVPLFFAPLFGMNTADIAATATAMATPRDIAIVADLSASHADDSRLHNYQSTEVNLWNVWAAMGDGIDSDQAGYEQHAGPRPGYMAALGWGEMTLDEDYDPAHDDGLAYLPPSQSWTDARINSALFAQGYNSAEVSAITTDTGNWNLRVATALGLATWRSGIAGGKWESDGQPAGDRDGRVESGELNWADYPFEVGSWSDYINNVASSRTNLVRADSAFQYRYGPKTYASYVLDSQIGRNKMSAFVNTPLQPMQAVKDGIALLSQIITELDGGDLVSLEAYDETGHHEVDLTRDYAAIANHMASVQAGYYGTWTCMGAGIDKAIAELTGPRSRSNAVKYMFLLTDGRANVNAAGGVNDYVGGRTYALEAAQRAAEAGIQIFAISVGSGADRSLMQEIAEIGGGSEFYAAGSIEQYSAELQQIFDELARLRPVMLIE